jgi:hypothetical protein
VMIEQIKDRLDKWIAEVSPSPKGRRMRNARREEDEQVVWRKSAREKDTDEPKRMRRSEVKGVL